MNILITGACGFIGTHMCKRAIKAGHTVYGLDNLNDYYDVKLKTLNKNEIIKQGVKFEKLDLVTDDLSQITSNIDIIFHFAAQPGIASHVPFENYLQNNFVATYRLLEAVKQNKKLKCFVNIATSSIYGNEATENENTVVKPTSFYGVTKLAAEQLVMSYHRDKNFPACSLRLFSVYGPGERPEKMYPKLISAIYNNTKFPLFEGSEKHLRSYTYIEDIVDGFMGVLNNYQKCIGEIINIGTDITESTGKGIALVEEIIGKKANIEIVPKRPGDQKKTSANIDKARKLINYNPKTTLKEGIEKAVKWYKEEIFERKIY